MSTVIAWASLIFGVAVLLGISKAISGWELQLSINTTQWGGQLFLFVLGLLLLICGIVQVFSHSKLKR